MRFFLTITGLLTCISIFGQTYLNLDFETRIYPTFNPKKWKQNGFAHDVKMDSTTAFSGKYSIRMLNRSSNDSVTTKISNEFPIGFASTNTMRISVKVKTKFTQTGKVGIFLNTKDADENSIESEVVFLTENTKDMTWTTLTTELYIPANARKVFFGGVNSSIEPVWYDDFQIHVDGEQFEEDIPKVYFPSKSELQWLKKQIIPITSFDPNEEDFSGLEMLKKVFDSSKVIALGEVTHGSSEIYQMKHRIIKYLVEYLGFSIFSIEGNMPEAYALNSFVMKNSGDAQTLIGGMKFWTWYTEEMLALVNWMNKYNQGNDKKVSFTGFDMQSHKGPINELKKSNPKPEIITLLDNLDKQIDSVRSKIRGRLNVSDFFSKDLLTLKDYYETQFKKGRNKNWLLQNIRILEQMTNNGQYYKRDLYMSENVKWILNQNPEAKTILWGHNGHIKKTGVSMGKYLKQELEEDYLSIGFAFYEGSYNAYGETGIHPYKAETAYPGTYEFFFSSIDEPIFMIDLRNLSTQDRDQQWLLKSMRFRGTGAIKVEDEFQETSISDDYDLLIFINKSHASKFLSKKKN